jgi:hypothetical protein
MLVQLPRGASGAPKASTDEECSAFEAALRRDLASAPVISYDQVLGGWAKRTIDLILATLTAPVWAPAVLLAAAWSKARHSAPVFTPVERIGYGGRTFACYRLRIAPPSAVIEHLHPQAVPEPANDLGVIASRRSPPRSWSRSRPPSATTSAPARGWWGSPPSPTPIPRIPDITKFTPCPGP